MVTEDWSQVSLVYSHTLHFQASRVDDDFEIGGDKKTREAMARHERARRARGLTVPPRKAGIIRGRDARFYVGEEIYPSGVEPECGDPSRRVRWVERSVLFELNGRFTWDRLEHIANGTAFLT